MHGNFCDSPGFSPATLKNYSFTEGVILFHFKEKLYFSKIPGRGSNIFQVFQLLAGGPNAYSYRVIELVIFQGVLGPRLHDYPARLL